MKYLLDTHIAIWTISNKAKLSKQVKTIIDSTANDLCISIVSAWEIAIKVGSGKLDFEGGTEAFFQKMQENGVELISVNESHIKHVEMLPLIHRDPFDRILISTAKVDGMTILTADENIHKYDVLSVW